VRLRLPIAILGLPLLTAACGGVPEKSFIEEYEPLFCEGYAICATEEMLRTVNARECLQFLRQQDYPEPPECNYDAQAASDCIEELTAAGCVDNDPEVPEVCERVYSGCRVPRIPPEEGFRED